MTFYYLYNLQQSLYFINAGLKVIEIGVGNKGDVYHKFERNAESEAVFTEWIKGSSRYKGDLNDESRLDNPGV